MLCSTSRSPANRSTPTSNSRGDREYFTWQRAADKIFLMPASALDLTGVATYAAVSAAASFDKIGVYRRIIHHVGDYKTAVEPAFIEKGYTPSHREMDESLNRDLYEQIVARRRTTAERRPTPKCASSSTRTVSAGRRRCAPGCVDEVAYEDQVDERLTDGDARELIDGPGRRATTATCGRSA